MFWEWQPISRVMEIVELKIGLDKYKYLSYQLLLFLIVLKV